MAPISRWRKTHLRRGLLLLLVMLSTACGGVINPPVPASRPIPPTRLPTVVAPPTPAPEPEPEHWVKNHRPTEMWSGPRGEPGVVSFGRTSSAFCSFRVEGETGGSRIHVYNPYADGDLWIDADAVGPVETPPHRPGPKPSGMNCSEIVYDAQLALTPGLSSTTTAGPGPTATAIPVADPRTGQPLVMALYYPWYDLETWASGQTADLPAEPYLSSDPATVARQVGMAREAGIDVLVSAWYGPLENNPTETNFKTLLTASERAGLRAALLLETDNDEFFASRTDMVRALRQFLTIHADQPAYLRVDGHPVILVWNPKSVHGQDGRRINLKGAAAVDAWASLIREVDPDRRALWIAEGDYFDFLRVFDGMFPYSVAWSADPASQVANYGRTVRDRASGLGARKVWAATAMPGYDDTRIVGRPGTFAVPRQNGSYYERSFQGAIDSRPDWIVITSFNEWMEGTQIEPSTAYGRHYLDLTRVLSDRFRARSQESGVRSP